jgi:DNA anti-recombination protein RmuC|tara:strand:+ start:404 stop:856 length:453 start_codon:yes stop_codon:yes gene_type:complete
MAEVEYNGIKMSGSKIMVILPLLGTLIGGLWGGFELYNRLVDAEEKINALQPQVIMAEVERMESVFNFIKEDLEGQIEDIEKDTNDAEDLVEEIEDESAELQRELRDSVYDMEKDMQDRFKEMDQDIRDMRSDLEDRIEEILSNPLNDVE